MLRTVAQCLTRKNPVMRKQMMLTTMMQVMIL